MRGTLLILIQLLIPFLAQAQQFETVTLLQNGPPDKRINFVFLSDGYQANELSKFESDVHQVMDKLFSNTPFKEYKSYFNVYAIKVPSTQSGASHPGNASDEGTVSAHPIAVVNNYFGSTFDYAGIHRLLVSTNTTKIANVLAANMPSFDQAFILVNSPYYGGSGGQHAISSIHPQGPEVSIHEIGHSIAQLADEYWAGQNYAREKSNLTKETNPALVKWKNWYNEQGVGIYPHAESPSWNRPHQNCKMRSLGNLFCAVCRESIVERFHQLVTPLDSWSPVNSTVSSGSESLAFTLQLLKPNPNTIDTKWTLNGQKIKNNNNVLELNINDLQPGNNALTATVLDTSSFSRSASHGNLHLYTVNWTITHTPNGILTESEAKKLDLEFYPNPVSDFLHIKYNLDKPSDLMLDVLALDGKKLLSKKVKRQIPGEYQIDLPLQKLKPGIYLLQVTFNGTSSYTQRIIKSN